MSSVHLATGITVHYEESGAGASPPPVVLLHAWAESLRVFDRLRPLLDDSLHVVTFDQRGHGGSDKPVGGYDLGSAADDVAALLRALDLPPAVLVGTSSGGYVAQQVAVAHRELVAGLVLVGAPRSLQGRPSFADEVEALTDPIDREWLRASLDWFPRFQPVPGWFVDDRVEDGVACPARAMVGVLHGLIDAVPPSEAGTITVPTTIVWGERDDLLPRADANRLHRAIGDSRLVVLPDTGHLVLWERPEHVAPLVVSMVMQRRAAAG